MQMPRVGGEDFANVVGVADDGQFAQPEQLHVEDLAVAPAHPAQHPNGFENPEDRLKERGPTQPRRSRFHGHQTSNLLNTASVTFDDSIEAHDRDNQSYDREPTRPLSNPSRPSSDCLM